MKLLIAIPTCGRYEYFDGEGHGSNMVGRREMGRRTWQKRFACLIPSVGDKPSLDLVEFVGRGAEGDVVLDAPDDYAGLPAKVQAMFRWALDQGYDYVFKCDDDVYVWPDRLLERFEPTDYRGFMAEAATGPYVCGAAYWVSRKAMEVIVNTEWDGHWAEDKWVGRTLAAAGIKPEHDARFRVCHCELCEEAMPEAECTSLHVWPDISRMERIYAVQLREREK